MTSTSKQQQIRLRSELEHAAEDFGQMEPYWDSVGLALRVDEITERLPKHRGYLRHRIRRSVSAVVLNLAQSAGARLGHRRNVDGARESAHETIAGLHLALVLGDLAQDEVLSLLMGLRNLIQDLDALLEVEPCERATSACGT